MFLKEGIVLKSIGKRFRTILTLEGEISFKRSLLIPADPESKSLLEERYGLKTVAPLDMALGIDRLPFSTPIQDLCLYDAGHSKTSDQCTFLC